MRKVLLGTSVIAFALLLSWDGGTSLTISDAQARIGRPGTYFSVAGMHRRAVRRTFGVGANLGWRGVYHRRVAWHRWHQPFVAGAALPAYTAGVLPYGRGCSCGWNNWHGYNAYPGIGYGGFGSGFGFRPGFGFGAPGFGWHRGWF